MNKMVINHLEKIFVTSDAATILRESDIHHPAAKMVAQAAKMQENECGDGSNFVLSVAGELMVQAQSLLQMGLHPSEILIGYEKGAKYAQELLDECEANETPENYKEAHSIINCLNENLNAWES